MSASSQAATNNLEAFWMPFTANRQFKQAPRMFVSAKDMHYTTADGRQVLDGTAGLWCCNAGHSRPKVVEAVQKQIAELDFAGVFDITLQVLGLTPDHLRDKAVDHLGEEAVGAIEFVWGFIDAAIQGGLSGL